MALVAPAPAVAASASKLGGISAVIGHGIDPAACGGVAAPSPECVSGYRLKVRVIGSTSSSDVAWVEIEGMAGVEGAATAAWRWHRDTSTTPHTPHAGCRPTAGANACRNGAGDANTANPCASYEAAGCLAFPFQNLSGFTGLSAGAVVDTGSVSNYGWRTVTQADPFEAPRLRVCARVASTGKECTAWATPSIHTHDDSPSYPAPPAPSAEAGTTITGTDTEDTGAGDPFTGTDCGAWWHLICHLTRLFVPTTIGSSFAQLSASLETSLPFGPIIWGLGAYADAIDGLADGISTQATPPACTWGPRILEPLLPGTTVDGVVIPLGEILCVEDPQGFEQIRQVTRWASAIMFVIGGLLLLVRLFGWATGSGAAQVTGGGDQ